MDAVSEAIDYAELQVACGLTDPESRREGMRMVFEAVKASPPVNFVQASVVLTKLMDSSLGASDRVSIAAAVNKKVVVHAPPVELRKQDVVAPPPNEPSPSGAAKPPPAPAAAQPTVAQTAAQTAPRPDASLAAPDKAPAGSAAPAGPLGALGQGALAPLSEPDYRTKAKGGTRADLQELLTPQR